MPEPLTLGWVPCWVLGATEEGGPGKWWQDIGIGKEHRPAAGSGMGQRGIGPHTCRQERGYRFPQCPSSPGAQVVPPAPVAVGTEAGLAFREEGRDLPKSPLTRKAKVTGTIPPFHAGRPGRSVLELTEGGSPSQAAQDKQGGRKFPRSQDWRPGASAVTCWGLGLPGGRGLSHPQVSLEPHSLGAGSAEHMR